MVNDPATPQAAERTPRFELRFEIPTAKVEALQKVFAAMEKRARRIGAPAPSVELGEPFVENRLIRSYVVEVAHTQEWGRQIHGDVELCEAVVTHDGIVMPGGWRLVGVLERVPEQTLKDGSTIEAHNRVRALPGEELPTEYRARVGLCDHCNTTRRRNTTFVVADATGAFRQVGTDCVRDFLGHDPAVLQALFEFRTQVIALTEGGEGGLSFLDDDGGRRSWSPTFFRPRDVIALSRAVYRQAGYLSATNARDFGGTSTARTVWTLLTGREKDWAEFRRSHPAFRGIEAEDDAFAELVAGWIADPSRGDADYFYNLRSIIATDGASLKETGLLVSSVPAYARYMERVLAAPTDSEWLGKPGERTTMRVKLVNERAVGEDFRPSFLLVLADDAGNRIKYFSSRSNATLQLPADRFASVKATIKGHTTYDGIKETMITRMSVLSIDPPSLVATAERARAAPPIELGGGGLALA